MENLINELKEQERKIKAELEKETEKATLEELKADFERLKKEFNQYSPSQEKHTKKEAFQNYNIYLTNYNFYIDKIKKLYFEQIEKAIKEAYKNILLSDELLTDLVLNHINKLNQAEESQAKEQYKKITNILLLFNEVLEG